MAKKPTKAQLAAQAAAAAATNTTQAAATQTAQAPQLNFNLALLSQVVQATKSAEGYGYFQPTDELKQLHTLAYIEVGNPNEQGAVATRVTPDGETAEQNAVAAAQAAQAAALQAQAGADKPSGAPAGFGGFPGGAAQGGFTATAPAHALAQFNTNTVAAQPQTAAPSQFKVVTTGLQIPAAKRFGKSATYPFAALEVGHGFFVPATNERPKPWKSLASTVASATARYDVLDGKNADGTDKYKHTRMFTLRNLPDGAAAGFGAEYAGVAGAGVYRTA